jgi:cytoskeleton protein RodZ
VYGPKVHEADRKTQKSDGQGVFVMSVVVHMPEVGETKDRRLHLRDVADTCDGQTVGQILRGRREALGLDERTVATRLCIRRDLIVAIEAGDHARLPGRAYALGFIRSYAQMLGLDTQQLIARFKAETQAREIARTDPLMFPDTVPTRRPVAFHLAGAAAMLAGIAYIVFQSFTAGPAEEPVAVVDAVNPVTVVDPAPAVVASAPVAPAALVAAAVPADASASAVAVAAPVLAAALPVTPAPAAAAPLGSRITLKASEPSYVEVNDPSLSGPDSVLLARELASGESFDVPDRAGLVLLTGNAGGLQVAIDGRDTGPLGARGQVIRRLVLDPAYFQSRPDTSR